MPYGNRDNENTFGKEREAYTAIDRPENYRAKLANASFRTARPGPPGFGEKSSSPGGLAVFSRKPCLSGSVCRKALVVQRAAKARVFTIKIIES